MSAAERPEQEGLTQEQAVLAEREACAQIADSAATIARCKAEPGLQIAHRALWNAVAHDALEISAAIRARPPAASPTPPAGRKATPPTKEGFFWAKWKIKAPGTAEEDDAPYPEWEVMHVVENCIDETDPEYLMVMVPGVAAWQPLENFFWGSEVALAAGGAA